MKSCNNFNEHIFSTTAGFNLEIPYEFTVYTEKKTYIKGYPKNPLCHEQNERPK